MEKAIALSRSLLRKVRPAPRPMPPAPQAAEAEEKVKTVRETEAANRRKSIDVLMAEKAAEEARL
jgi:hypothetical protein